MHLKVILAITTIIAVNTQASTLRVGLLNPQWISPNLYGGALNVDYVQSNQWGYGAEIIGASQVVIGGADFIYGLGGHGIKKWIHSPHRRAEMKIGGGWLAYGNAGGGQEFDDGSYQRQSLYARFEPSYHFWWKFIGLKTFALGQISRRGFDYGAGLGLELGWEYD